VDVDLRESNHVSKLVDNGRGRRVRSALIRELNQDPLSSFCSTRRWKSRGDEVRSGLYEGMRRVLDLLDPLQMVHDLLVVGGGDDERDERHRPRMEKSFLVRTSDAL